MSRVGPRSFALHVLFLDCGVPLCPGSGGCSGCETVDGISLGWSGLLPPRGAWWRSLPCVGVCVVDVAWDHNVVTFEDYLINTFMNIIKYCST